MYEVEVKVRASHDLVREALAGQGAERTGTVVQTDTYYDAPHREFAETDEALRVRRETPVTDDDADSDEENRTATRLTYKGPLVETASKTREEHETAVADETAIEGILEGLGFEPAAVVEKERDRYILDGYTVTLDDVTGLGEFVEVEREALEADIEPVREGALDVLRALGVDPDEQVRTSYLGLLLAVEDDDT